MKKIFIGFFIILLLVSCYGCKKKNNKNDNEEKNKTEDIIPTDPTEGDKNPTDPSEGEEKIPTDTLKDYTIDHLPEFTRTNLRVQEDPKVRIETKKVDEKLLKDKENFEKELVSYLSCFGINELELPLAESYPSTVTTNNYIDYIQDDTYTYRDYLDKIFKDWEKDTLFGVSYIKYVNGQVFSVEFDVFSDSMDIIFNRPLEEWNIKYIDSLKYNSIYQPNTPSGVKVVGTMYQTYSQTDFTYYLLDNEYYCEDGSFKAYFDFYNKFYYKLDSNNKTTNKVDIPKDTVDFASYYYDAYGLGEGIKHSLIYIHLCQNNDFYTFAYLYNYEHYRYYSLVEYTYIDGRKTAHLTTSGSQAYRIIDFWVDVETGIPVKTVQKTTTGDVVIQESKLYFGDFEIEKTIDLVDPNTQIINVKESYSDNEYTVNFYNHNKELIYQEQVKEHESVKNVPDDLENLIGYDYNLNDVTSDMEVYGIYTTDYNYTVHFIDNLGNDYGTINANRYDTLTYPEVPDIEGYTKTKWNCDVSFINSDLEVKFIYKKINQYTVKFYSKDEELIDEQKVYEGESAIEPDVEKNIGSYKFIGWSLRFDNVKQNIDTYAVYENTSNPYTYGSVNYYVLELYDELDDIEDPHEQQQYLFDLSAELAYACGSSSTCEEFLNLGEALTIVFPIPQVLNNYGVLLINNSQKKKAIDYIECAHEYDKYNFVYATNLAQLVFENDVLTGDMNFEAALDLVEDALKQNPEYGPALQLKSEIYLLQGKEQESIELMLESALYIWNDVSIAQFTTLYNSIDELFYDLQDEYPDTYQYKWKSPIEDLLADFFIVGTLNGSDFVGCEDISYEVNVSPSQINAAYSELSNESAKLDKLSENKALEKEPRVEYYLNYFESGDPDCTQIYLGDMRQFTMYMFIEQYYTQLAIVNEDKISDNINDAINDVYEGEDEKVEEYGLGRCEEFDTFEKQYAIIMSFGDEYLERLQLEANLDIIDFQIDLIRSDVSKAISLINDEVSSLYADFYNEFLEYACFIAEDCTDDLICDYIYNRIMNVIYNSYITYYGRLITEMENSVYSEGFLMIYRSQVESQLAGVEQREADEAFENARPKEPEKSTTKVTPAISINSPNFFGYCISAELNNDAVLSITLDKPYESTTIGFDFSTLNSSITTVQYGFIDGVTNVMFNNDTDAFKEFFQVGASMKVAYGTSTTFDWRGNVVDYKDIKVTTVGGSIKDWGGEVSVTEAYNTATGSYVYSSSSVKASFKFVNLSVGLE